MTAARDDRSRAAGRRSAGVPSWADASSGPAHQPRFRPEPDGYETSGPVTPPRPGDGRAPYESGEHVFDIADDRRDDRSPSFAPPPRTESRDPLWTSPPPSSHDPGPAPTTAMAVPSAHPYPVAPPPPPRRNAPPPPAPELPTPREAAPTDDPSEMVRIIRESFAAVAPRADELTQLFYGWLFSIAPETRELFPVTMELQRTRLLRALVHVVQMVDRPDELTTFLRQLGRDHRKFGVVGEHYDKVGEALLGAIGEIAGDLWTPEVSHSWTSAYGIVAQAMRDAADAERGPAVWMARVMEHQRIDQDLAIVRVQTSQPVPYLAGQYVSVETPQRPRMWRSMSPANAPGSDCVMEFHVRTVPGGWVSRAIVSHARVGDVWRIGPPMGQMTLDPRSRSDLLMVAGGTGLAPARAIIEQLTHEGTDRKVCLFVGGRSWTDLYDVDRLRRAAQEYPWLTVVPVVEDDGRRYGAETGTLAEVVSRYGAWADREVVVAGSPPMVRSTVSAMLDAGTSFSRIHYDPYHTD